MLALSPNLVQVGLINKINHQTFFGAVAKAGTNHTAHFFNQL